MRLKMKFIFYLSFLVIVSCNSIQEKKQDSDSVVVKKDSALTESKSIIITLDLESLDLIIDSSNTDKMKIIKGYNENEVTYEETISDNEIEIVSKGKEAMVSNPGKIEIQVPPNCIIISKMMSGNIKVNKITCKSISIESKSSDIKIKDLVTNNAKIRTMSGDILFNGAVVEGNITLHSMSGNLNIFLNKESNVKLELVSQKSNVFIDGNLSNQNPINKILKDGKGLLSASTMSGNVDFSAE